MTETQKAKANGKTKGNANANPKSAGAEVEADGADAGGGPPFHAAPSSPEVEILDEGLGESLGALSDDDKPEG